MPSPGTESSYPRPPQSLKQYEAGASIRPLDAPTLGDGQDTERGSTPRRESNPCYARAELLLGRIGFEFQVVDQEMLRLPGSQEDERYRTMAFSIYVLPSRPGQMVAFDPLGPLPRTNQGNEHVLLVVDRFSRRVEGYALSADEKTTQDCAAKLVHG